MLKEGALDLLVNRKTNDVLVCKYALKTKGTLTGWFAYGRLYRTSVEEIMSQGLEFVQKIIRDEQADYVDEKAEIEKKPGPGISKHKFVSIRVFDGEVSISPMAVKRNWAGISKYTIKLKFPVDHEAFTSALERAIKDA